MVNYGAYDTVPKEYADRNLYKHNPSVTLMRTNVEENELIGGKIVEKLNMTQGPTAFFIPKKGVSMIDAEGQPFQGIEEDKALFKVLKDGLDQDAIEIIELDQHINDQAFAEAMAQKLLDMMKK
jgi:uncharacterized protein (UPF0261 family)